MTSVVLIEPAIVPDTLISGVGRVDELAPNLFRVTFCAKHVSLYEEGLAGGEMRCRLASW